MRFGISYLAGAKFPQVVLDEHPNGWDAKIFATTFGDAYPLADKLLATGRCPNVWIQTLWDDDHSYGEKDIPVLQKVARKYQQLQLKHKDKTIWLSAFCEHRLKNPDKYIEIIRREAPSCRFFNSPEKRTGAFSKVYLNDIHNADAPKPPNRPYTFDYDGEDAFGADVESHKKKFADCEVFFLWSPHLNLKYKLDDKTPRDQRKYRPKGKHIDALIYLTTSKGKTKLPPDYILKPVSEDTQGFTGRPDAKSNKVCFICPPNVKEIKLVAIGSNQVIDSAKNYGLYKDKKRYRYYTTLWGFEIAEKAKRITGDPRVRLFINGKEVGVVNPAFRDGSYR